MIVSSRSCMPHTMPDILSHKSLTLSLTQCLTRVHASPLLPSAAFGFADGGEPRWIRGETWSHAATQAVILLSYCCHVLLMFPLCCCPLHLVLVSCCCPALFVLLSCCCHVLFVCLSCCCHVLVTHALFAFNRTSAATPFFRVCELSLLFVPCVSRVPAVAVMFAARLRDHTRRRAIRR